MNYVWVVVEQDCDDSYVVGVFATEQTAKQTADAVAGYATVSRHTVQTAMPAYLKAPK